MNLNALSHTSLPDNTVAFRNATSLAQHLQGMTGIHVEELGTSRDGHPLWGYTMGTGPMTVSITAGCHADEPIGPMTAQVLPALIHAHAPELLTAFNFRVAPQMNPDGAERNRPWFSETPDFITYINHAVREMPGDDVEFGFSEGPEARPECRAAIPFLWKPDPVVAHFSLHGMAWAEGAWYLLNYPWADRSDGLIRDLLTMTAHRGLPLHEIDRKGAKGFTRIVEGVATTPSSVAMKAFFEAANDPAMAAKFLPSSMEVAMATGNDPLCMVSELPLFLLDVPGSIDDPVLFQFRDALNGARSTGGQEPLVALMEQFRMRPLAIETQIQLQFAMIVRALHHVLDVRSRPSK